MPLRIPGPSPVVPKSPEALFETLRSRDPKIRALWAHQADLLRAYEKHLESRDVAVELPTGDGKTLVMLLIAEYRRQSRGERIAYLCPTRQLAHQVGERAREYGIPATVLVGSRKHYEPKDLAAFSTGSKIAITTYNGVFNTNPALSNDQCLVLDDAHAAENYVGSFWSLEISRSDHSDLYAALLELLADDLPDSLVQGLRRDDPSSEERRSVGVLLQSALWKHAVAMRDLIAAHVAGEKLQYPWSVLREHLDACNVFLSWNEILIRPLSPPVETHAPFWSANQRLYASATLGVGGELERATGVRKIVRLPLPAGRERRTSGRRLILLPQLSIDEGEVRRSVAELVTSEPRALVLCPNQWQAQVTQTELINQGVTKPILNETHVEDTLDEFTGQEAVLLLKNRYDGLDLPDDACRILVIDGLPDATNLQEKFLSERLRANALLVERVRTRITQALGRCTRNSTDYAVVLLVGGALTRRIVENEFQEGMAPELQVELTLGIQNSQDTTEAEVVATARDFLSESDVRGAVEQFVAVERGKREVRATPAAEALADSAQQELNYLYAAWSGNWEAALHAAKGAVDKLSGGKEVRPFQAFWLYLAASAAIRVAQDHKRPELLSEAKVLRDKALGFSTAISWFAGLQLPEIAAPATRRDPVEEVAVENALRELRELGAQGPRFDGSMKALLEDLKSEKAPIFEGGLARLGRLLGFESDRTGTEKGAPDSVWRVGNAVFIGFEAKSDVEADKEISITDTRQVSGHADWIREKYPAAKSADVVAVLATYQHRLDGDAVPHARDTKYLMIPAVQVIAQDLAAAMRAVRAEAGSASEDEMLVLLAKKLRDAKLLPRQLLERMSPLKSKVGGSAKAK